MEKKELEKLYELYYERVYYFLKKLSGDEKLSGDLAQETFVLDLLLQKEEYESLRNHLKKLSPTERRMIECFYGKGLSGIETAALLGVSPGSVRVALHRAREKLMKEIKKED